MQATFGFRLAGPASRATLTRLGTVRTANRGIAFFDQRVERQIMLSNVLVSFRLGDIDHGIEFTDASTLLKNSKLRAMLGLPAHEAGDPDIVIGLDLLQWLYLVN